MFIEMIIDVPTWALVPVAIVVSQVINAINWINFMRSV